MSLPEIGRLFSDKHHTTALHAIRKIAALREEDPEFDRLLAGFHCAVSVTFPRLFHLPRRGPPRPLDNPGGPLCLAPQFTIRHARYTGERGR